MSAVTPEALAYFAGPADDIENADVYKRLSRDGILFARFHRPTRHAFKRWFKEFFTVIPHPHADRDGLTRVRPHSESGVDVSGEGFTPAALDLHDDGAGLDVPPPIVALLMVSPSKMGGTTVLADSRAVLVDLLGREPWVVDELKAAGALSWGPEQVTLPIIDERPSGRIIIRYRTDYPVTSKDERASEAFAALAMRYELNLVEVQLAVGDALILHNHRWLHGRRSFKGEREVWRLLGKIPSSEVAASELNAGFIVAA